MMKSLKTKWKKGKRISKPEWDTDEEWTITYDTKAGSFSKYEAEFSTTTEKVTLQYETPARPENTPYGEYVLSNDWSHTTSELVYDHGQYWLHLVVKRYLPDQHWTQRDGVQVSDAPAEEASRVLGVDLNVKGSTAVTSAGEFHGNADQLNHRRKQYERLRGELQETGTRSAYLKMKERSGTEAAWFDQFARDVTNDVLDDALRTRATHIVLETLTGIRKRMSNQPKYQQWLFKRVQQYVECRAAEYGIKVVFVNPKNTSKSCSHIGCGHTSDSNRRGDSFDCGVCGRSWHSDYNAGRKIGIKWLFENEVEGSDSVPACQTCSSGKATSQLALMSGVLSVRGRSGNGVQFRSMDWASTDKPMPTAIGD